MMMMMISNALVAPTTLLVAELHHHHPSPSPSPRRSSSSSAETSTPKSAPGFWTSRRSEDRVRAWTPSERHLSQRIIWGRVGVTPKRPHYYYFQLKLCISSLLCRHNNKYSTTTICSTHRVLPLRRFLSPRRRRRRQSRRKTNTTRETSVVGPVRFVPIDGTGPRERERERGELCDDDAENGDDDASPTATTTTTTAATQSRGGGGGGGGGGQNLFKEAARKRRNIPSFSNGRNQTRSYPRERS